MTSRAIIRPVYAIKATPIRLRRPPPRINPAPAARPSADSGCLRISSVRTRRRPGLFPASDACSVSSAAMLRRYATEHLGSDVADEERCANGQQWFPFDEVA